MDGTPELPPNWRSARAADGKEYYFNELTGETSWTVPTVAKEEPETAPPTLTAEPLGDDDKPKPAPTPFDVSPAPAAGSRMGMADDNMTGDAGVNDVASDLRIGGPGTSNFYESLGPGGFKLLIILISSMVVLVESAILVDKLKKADAMVLQPLDPALVDNITVTDEVDGATVENPAGLTLACKQAGSLAGLSLELLEGGLSADPDNSTYGVVLATVSLVLTAAFMALAKFKPAVLSRFALPIGRFGLLSAQQVFYAFLLIWWGPGTGVLTFHGPYRTTGNPYFACWAALVTSALLCADAFTKMKVGMDRMKAASSSYLREMFGLFVASVTLMFASIDFASHSTGAYGVSLGVISTVASAVLTYLIDKNKLGAPLRKAVSAVMLILWAAGTIVLTFDSPFTSTGNGYFACWMGVVCAALFAYREFFEMQVRWVDGRFQSFSCKDARQEMPVVSESLGNNA